jgi:hypothetical protein
MPIVSVADSPALPVITNVHAPAPTGVIENAFVPFGAIVAMPVHVVVAALKLPDALLWLALTRCAKLAPTFVNARLADESTTAPGVGACVGDGDGDGDGDAGSDGVSVGVGDAVGVGVGVAIPGGGAAVPLHAHNAAVTATHPKNDVRRMRRRRCRNAGICVRRSPAPSPHHGTARHGVSERPLHAPVKLNKRASNHVPRRPAKKKGRPY